MGSNPTSATMKQHKEDNLFQPQQSLPYLDEIPASALIDLILAEQPKPQEDLLLLVDVANNTTAKFKAKQARKAAKKAKKKEQQSEKETRKIKQLLEVDRLQEMKRCKRYERSLELNERWRLIRMSVGNGGGGFSSVETTYIPPKPIPTKYCSICKRHHP